jgi:PhnB protein
MSKRPPKPEEYPWIMPFLTVKDPDAALAFYQKAFGFEKKMSMPGPDGKTMHAEVSWRGQVVMFGGETPENPCKAPITLGVRPPSGLYVYVDDVDALFKRATAAGAKVDKAPADQFWGDRTCSLIDPDGHIWGFGTNVGEFDPSKAPK